MNSIEHIDKRPFREQPFEYLDPSRKDVLHAWYQARAYVLHLLIDTLRGANTYPSCWHFVVDGDSDLMLSVVRHLALYAHFISYGEYYDQDGKFTCKNRTVISIGSKATPAVIMAKLVHPDFLGNLPKHCPITLFGKAENQDSYIDIAIDVVKDVNSVSSLPENLPVITEEKVLKYIESIDPKDLYSVHTLKAICASKAYDLGDAVNNLPYEDINSARRYFNALNTFRRKVVKTKKSETLIQEEDWINDRNTVRSGVSNIFCSDCFEIREMEIKHKAKTEDVLETWLSCMKELADCEHNRWVVERLILGYEPLSPEEKFTYEHLFGDDRAAYLKSLKKKADSPKHIDLCSNRDLRRIDPDNMKYDSVLTLAIPFILDYVRTQK